MSQDGCEPSASKRGADETDVNPKPPKSFHSELASLGLENSPLMLAAHSDQSHLATPPTPRVGLPVQNTVQVQPQAPVHDPLSGQPPIALDIRDQKLVEMMTLMQQQQMQMANCFATIANSLNHIVHNRESDAQRAQPEVPTPGDADQHVGTDGNVSTLVEAVAQHKPKVVKSIAPDVEKHFSKTFKTFDKSLKSYQILYHKLEKARADIEVLANSNETDPKYPAGTRPFKFQVEETALENTFKPAADNHHVFQLVIPVGWTKLATLKALHYKYTLWHKQVYEEAYSEHLASPKPLITKTAFINACDSFTPDDNNEAATSLGIEAPSTAGPNVKLLADKVSTLYSDLVKQAALREKQLQETKEKEKQKSTENQAKTVDSPTILTDVISKVFDEKLQQTGLLNSESGDANMNAVADSSQPADGAGAAEAFCNAMGKGKSAAEIASEGLKGKGKGKGKSSGDVPKGKGKGKGKGKHSTGDKGKGKGKSSAGKGKDSKGKGRGKGSGKKTKNGNSPSGGAGQNQNWNPRTHLTKWTDYNNSSAKFAQQRTWYRPGNYNARFFRGAK